MYYFTWFAEGRVDVLAKYPEMLSTMYNAGLRKLQLGIESGRQETLDVYNKNITLEQIESVILEASKYPELTIHGNIMMANPKESFDEYLISIDFFKKLAQLSDFRLDIGATYLAPFAGTQIRMNPGKFEMDILIENFEFRSSAMNHIICKSKKMTLSEVFSLRSFTYAKLTDFFRTEIFKYSKKEILSLTNILNKANSGILIGGIFNQLPSFKRFFKIAANAATLTEVSDTCLCCCPVRLWDVEFKTENGYSFTSLKNEKYTMKDLDLELWELASGKNSLLEIHQIANSNFANEVTIEYILSFYKKLDDNMAIVFRKY